jgi:biopolymer transport protein ExbD
MQAYIRTLATDRATLQIAPLIDVVFLLLIFFMVTSSLERQEADLGLTLPGSIAQSRALPIPDEQIIEVRADGAVVLNGRVFPPEAGPDLPALHATLVRYRQASEATRTLPLVTIQAEDDALHGRVVDVMNACAGAGIRHVSFGMGGAP